MSAVALELPRILSRVPVDALASATGRCKRTCMNWIDGITAPSGPDLIEVMRQFDDVSNDVLSLAGKRTLTDDQIANLKRALNGL